MVKKYSDIPYMITSIDGKPLQFVRLEEDTPISSFDCGDSDLNDFLQNDAKNYLKSMLAVTYLTQWTTRLKAVG